MKEKYWFAVLMVTFKRMEILNFAIYAYSVLCHKHPGFGRNRMFRRIYAGILRRYERLMWKRDVTIPKCEVMYWNWIERPFLIRW